MGPRLLLVSMLVSSACVRWSPPAMQPIEHGSCRTAPVTWYAPADAVDRRRLNAWCNGVGAPVVYSAPALDPSDRIEMHDVTFVSWNVHVGNGDVRAFVRDLRGGTITNGRPVKHCVLLLQEVVRTSDVPAWAPSASGALRIPAANARDAIDIVSVSRDLGLSLIYVPSMRNGSDPNQPAEDRGSAILSSLPLSAPIAVELPGERQRRVIILSRVGAMSVGVMHLDALGGASRLRVFWTPWMREVQVRAFTPLLPRGPLVLGADLNTWHGREEPATRLLNQLFADTRLSIERAGLGLRVLDYLFFRTMDGRAARYRELENRYGSDHRPLIGWVE